jgi:hypothetical protein
MRFQLRQTGWSIDGGRHFLPQGTIIDDSDPGGAAIMSRTGGVPPNNAQPLDQATYNIMKAVYPTYSIITMPGQDGITR